MTRTMPLMARLALMAAAGLMTAAQAQDAKAGEKKAAMCIGCHGIPGYQASFPEIHKVPMISGQSAKYIVGALSAYKKGERKHPTMKAIAGSLSDQDMADLAAFYEANGGPAANGDAPAPNPPRWSRPVTSCSRPILRTPWLMAWRPATRERQSAPSSAIRRHSICWPGSIRPARRRSRAAIWARSARARP